MQSISLEKVTQKEAAGLFGITVRAFRDWLVEGCPKNEDSTVNLKEVIKWKMEKIKNRSGNGDKQSADLEKVLKQNEKLDLEIAKMKKETIPRFEVEDMFKRAELELMTYIKDGYKRNGPELMYKFKQVEELKAFYEIFDGFWKEAMDNFIKSGEELE